MRIFITIFYFCLEIERIYKYEKPFAFEFTRNHGIKLFPIEQDLDKWMNRPDNCWDIKFLWMNKVFLNSNDWKIFRERFVEIIQALV